MTQNNALKASLEINGKKLDVEGQPDEVWKSLNKFIGQNDQKMTQLSQFIIKIDLNELLLRLKGIVLIDKDVGPVISSETNVNALNDTERIVFALLIKRIVNLLGFGNEEMMTVDEVQKETKSKSAGVLISQMIPEKIIQNVGELGKKGAYRITDYGINWFMSKVLPKLEKRND